MPTSEYVQVEGISSLIKELRKTDRLFVQRLHAKMRSLAREVQLVAKEKATQAGFAAPGRSGRGTGKLLSGIRYSVFGGTALIRETATRDGRFKYPAVYEYGHSKWGHRPFLEPARRATYARVYSEIERTLSGVLDDFH